MTLTEYLSSLPANPLEPGSPLLTVGLGQLTPEQRDQVTDMDGYARRPYAVIVGLPRGSPQRLHNKRTRMTGGLDVHLNQPASLLDLGQPLDPRPLAELQALLARAPDHVTEISDDYPLIGSLGLGTEIDPRTEDFDTFSGLTATTRFTYAIWR